MNEKTIWIIPFTGKEEKCSTWLGKITAREGIKEYHFLLTGAKEITDDGKDKIQEIEIAEPKLLNFTSYNELTLAKEDRVCFHIIEKAKREANKYGDVGPAWKKSSRKIEPTTGASKTRLRQKFSKYELNNVTRNPKKCITELELLKGDLKNLMYI